MKNMMVIVLTLVAVCAFGQEFDEPESGTVQPTTSVSPGSTSGTIMAQSGQSFLYPDGMPSQRIDLNKDDMIYSNYIVETLDSASLVIKLSDGKGYLQIGEKSNLQIQYYYSNKMRLGGFRILLNKGKIRAYCPGLNNPRLHFTVITPNSSIGVDFGDFSVEVKGEISQIITYMGSASVHYLSPNFTLNTKSITMPEEKKFLVSTKRGMLKSTIKPTAAEMEERNSWSKYGISVEYPEKETRQDVLIKKEIKKIEHESMKNPALRHTL